MDVTLDLSAVITSLVALGSTLVLVAGAVVLLVLFRHRIDEVIQLASGRVKKLSIAGFSVELAALPGGLAPKVSAPDLMTDLRQPTPSAQITDSNVLAFTQQLEDHAPSDYAIIDLGTGREWLTSRLFILSIVLARMRNLQALVFVEADEGVPQRFIGIATPESVRWALAQRYHWFEPGYAAAYQQSLPFVIVSRSGAMAVPQSPRDAWPAIQLVQNFVSQVQGPMLANDPEWVQLTDNVNVAEHAQWLTKDGLEAVLGNSLSTGHVSSVEFERLSEWEKIRRVLSHDGRFLPLTTTGAVLDRLLDREAIIARVADVLPSQ